MLLWFNWKFTYILTQIHLSTDTLIPTYTHAKGKLVLNMDTLTEIIWISILQSLQWHTEILAVNNGRLHEILRMLYWYNMWVLRLFRLCTGHTCEHPNLLASRLSASTWSVLDSCIKIDDNKRLCRLLWKGPNWAETHEAETSMGWKRPIHAYFNYNNIIINPLLLFKLLL